MSALRFKSFQEDINQLKGKTGLGFGTFPQNITVHETGAKEALDAFFKNSLELLEKLRNRRLSENYDEVVSMAMGTYALDEEKDEFLDWSEKCFADISNVNKAVHRQIVLVATFPEEIDGRESTIDLCCEVGIQAHYMHLCVQKVQRLRNPPKKDTNECEYFSPSMSPR
jgi:hypothetical protein